jgi:hypothetical protein
MQKIKHLQSITRKNIQNDTHELSTNPFVSIRKRVASNI